MDDEVLEKLSVLEHDQWCEWAEAISKDLSSLLAIIEKLDDDSMSRLSDEDKAIVSEVNAKLERWSDFMVPYSDLSEEVKEQDRVYARKILDTVKP